MIKLRNPKVLSDDCKNGLIEYQETVDNEADFPSKSKKARDLFKLKNVSGNKVFKEVRGALESMCYGTQRCNYCEDNQGNQVEHIYPKNIYPGKCFDFDNYLIACGICNGPKSDRFALFIDNSKIDVSPKRRQDPVEPPYGEALLVNPRIENPFEYIELDIPGTFYFTAVNDEKDSLEYHKAEYTIELLKLNSRDVLVEARKAAFHLFKSTLEAYIQKKNQGVSESILEGIKNSILKSPHPTVWLEMIRQRKYKDPFYEELNSLFNSAPETLDWM